MIRWAVSRPAVIWAVCASLLVAGGVSFTRLALATKTTVELPRLSVSASWPGSSAELMEMYVTAPIEAAIQGVRDVRRVTSRSNDGSTQIQVELDPAANVQLARLAILERLELLRGEFPPGAGRPAVSNYVPEGLEEAPLMQVRITGPYTPGALQKMLVDVVEPRLSAVPGVAGIGRGLGVEIGVSVSYDAQRLRMLGVPPDLLTDAISNARVVQALGTERLGATQRTVVLRDQPGALEDLADLPVRAPSGRVFALGELATIRADEDTRGQFYRIDGQPAIGLSVSRLPGADAIKTAAAVRAAIDEVQRALPTGAQLRVSRDESVALGEELGDLGKRGGIAFVAVLLVLALLLRDARAVALVMGSTAVSIAATALSLYVLDIPANLLTLAGLGMGVGILVQNALIVTERLRLAPATPEGRAAAAGRIGPAVLGSTLTTAVVLFPFLYLQGNARAAFVPFASAFVLALGWSVVTALLVVPALAGTHVFRRHHARRATRAYAWLTGWTLRLRPLTLLLSVAVLGVLTWGFIKKVPRFAWGGGFGAQPTTLNVSLSFPRGSDPERLDEAMREFEAIVLGQPGIDRVESQSRGINAAGMTVFFTEEGAFTATPFELEEALTQRAVFVGGANVSVRGQGPGFSAGMGGGTTASFRLRLYGYSYGGVQAFAEDIKARISTHPRVRDVSIGSADFFGAQRSSQVVLEPDRPALARYGLTAQQLTGAIGREVRGGLGGTRLEIGGEELPVNVKAQGARDRAMDELRDALVPTASGAPVRIGDLARVDEREALGSITREDQQYVRVLAYDFRGPARLAQRTHAAFLEAIAVPPGYRVEDAGYFSGPQDESQQGLWLVFGIGIALVVLAVAMVFDSAWGAALVFLSLPLSLGGVMAAFWLTGAAFTREAAVGVILVIGLAVNQAILLVDAALAKRRARQVAGGRRDLDAGAVLLAARERAGMIVIVTCAALASLLPLAWGTKLTSLFGAIALATAGGMLAGTVGTLFVLPAMLFGRRLYASRRGA
jgi:hydrophobic/amphiphilic exporter-1 (mainly G- bacteria), HAE1 family